MKIKKHINFSSLRRRVSEEFQRIPDWRDAKKVAISLHDAMMSGFACMYFQDPSLLQFQKRMQEEQHRNNLATLFDVQTIPKETQMRDLIDRVDSECFRPIFKDFYLRLQRSKTLEQFQLFPNQYYFAIDGSQFYSSDNIHCEQCLVRESKTGKQRYSHQVLQGGLMHPDCAQVIPFMPEQIVNSDGKTKQDCEMNAAKRFIKQLRHDVPQLDIILGGDGLFSKQPIIEEIKALKFHYLFVAKPKDHKYLFDWIAAYDRLESVSFVDKQGRQHLYEWMNTVPLHGGKEAICVNFLRCTVIGQNKAGEEEVVYKNSWVTDITINANIIERLVKGGRCRWKSENELFNVMKNHGYCMERNYGHGQQHLAFNVYLLTLLAFFFHQIFELTDERYQACRKKFGSKRHLWEKLRAYIELIIFESWEKLLDFALAPKAGLLQWANPP